MSARSSRRHRRRLRSTEPSLGESELPRDVDACSEASRRERLAVQTSTGPHSRRPVRACRDFLEEPETQAALVFFIGPHGGHFIVDELAVSQPLAPPPGKVGSTPTSTRAPGSTRRRSRRALRVVYAFRLWTRSRSARVARFVKARRRRAHRAHACLTVAEGTTTRRGGRGDSCIPGGGDDDIEQPNWPGAGGGVYSLLHSVPSPLCRDWCCLVLPAEAQGSPFVLVALGPPL